MDAIIRPHGARSTPKEKRDSRAADAYSHAQLKEMQQMPLEQKIEWTDSVIQKALEVLKTPALAFSAGKDSTVMLHRVLRFAPDVAVIYGNTTIEFPECVRFARQLKEEWHLNFYEATPDVSFWWVVRNYGWPLLGKTYGVGGVAHKDSREQFFQELKRQGKLSGGYRIQSEVPISSACCTFLKERPSIKIQKKLGVDGVFIGILASESRRRKFNFLDYGEWYYPKSQKVWKCHPLAIWTDDDIWEYIHRYNIPYAPLYDMGYTNEDGKWISHKRNGCMFCGMDIKFFPNHLSTMRRTHPRAWRTLMLKMGMGEILLSLHVSIYRQYDLFSEIMPLDEYVEKFPCAFDRI